MVKEVSKILPNNSDDFLTTTCFHPNVTVDNLETWAEFDLIKKAIEVIRDKDDGRNTPTNASPLQLHIIMQTVWCDGAIADLLNPELGTLDIPKHSLEYFPDLEPYL